MCDLDGSWPRSPPVLNTDEIDKSSQRTNRMGSDVSQSCLEKLFVFLSIFLCIILFPIAIFYIFMVIPQFTKAVIFRNGKVYQHKVFGPGLICYLPCIDSVKHIDMRVTCYDVPPQEVLTKDSLSATVDAVIFYRIFKPIRAVINVADYNTSTQFLAATTLRNALGTRKLAELLVNRAEVSAHVFKIMNFVTNEWGIHVVRVDIKNIYLPLQLQRAMAAEAESSRLARAKIIVANSEIEATKNLKLAMDILMENPMCMQLRYLMTLNMLSAKSPHTIVFPFSPLRRAITCRSDSKISAVAEYARWKIHSHDCLPVFSGYFEKYFKPLKPQSLSS